MLDVKAIHGEAGTGFEKRGDKGPFECGNCRFFAEESCGQKDMMAKSKQPRLANSRVKVDDDDCCEYIDRVGTKKSRIGAAFSQAKAQKPKTEGT